MHATKVSFIAALLAATALTAPASAAASFPHTVGPGESLSSVAAADGLSVSQLAAANGISADTQLIAGSTLQIPPQTAGAFGSSGSVLQTGSGTQTGSAPANADSGTSAQASSGSYVVQPGDTLSAIAARSGTTVADLAAANGLDPAGILPAGAAITVAGAGTSGAPGTPTTSDGTSSASSPSALSPSSVSGGSVQPTPESVSAAAVGSIAAANGVSPSLAEAIGYQESGFNNALVSSTGATGVMQIEPGTWNYIGQNLAAPPPLSPTSAQDNIRGGVLLLRSLLNQTGGDPAMAAAGYYQGMQSVQQNGLFADTQQYVNNVMALRQRFGGP